MAACAWNDFYELADQSALLSMEALSASEVPTGPQWQYEPKWDGFRCLAFRDGAHVDLQSKAGRSLARYFPEILEACLNCRPHALSSMAKS